MDAASANNDGNDWYDDAACEADVVRPPSIKSEGLDRSPTARFRPKRDLNQYGFAS